MGYHRIQRCNFFHNMRLTGKFQSILTLITEITLKANRTNMAITNSQEVTVTKRKKSIRPQEDEPLKSAAKANAIINKN